MEWWNTGWLVFKRISAIFYFNQKNSSMLCIGVNKIKIHFDTSQLCCGVVHLSTQILPLTQYCIIPPFHHSNRGEAAKFSLILKDPEKMPQQ